MCHSNKTKKKIKEKQTTPNNQEPRLPECDNPRLRRNRTSLWKRRWPGHRYNAYNSRQRPAITACKKDLLHTFPLKRHEACHNFRVHYWKVSIGQVCRLWRGALNLSSEGLHYCLGKRLHLYGREALEHLHCKEQSSLLSAEVTYTWLTLLTREHIPWPHLQHYFLPWNSWRKHCIMHRCWPGLFPEVYFSTTWWITSPPLVFRLYYKKLKVWCHHSEMIATNTAGAGLFTLRAV